MQGIGLEAFPAVAALRIYELYHPRISKGMKQYSLLPMQNDNNDLYFTRCEWIFFRTFCLGQRGPATDSKKANLDFHSIIAYNWVWIL